MLTLHLVTSKFDFTFVFTPEMDDAAPIWIYMHWIYVCFCDSCVFYFTLMLLSFQFGVCDNLSVAL